MKKEKRQKYEKFVKSGKWNYIYKYGLLRGFLIGTLFLFFDLFIFIRYNSEPIYKDIIIIYVIFLIGGFFFGLFAWRAINKKLNNKVY